MELVALLRILWRRRVYVALGLVLALAVGFAASRGETRQLGIASTRVVIDTVDSQLVDAEPVGADTLAWRAALLGDLMGSDAGRPRIAYSMGIPEKDLAVVAPHLNEPPKNTPAARRAAEAGAITTQPYVVAIQADGPLPIIDIDATAPKSTSPLIAAADADGSHISICVSCTLAAAIRPARPRFASTSHAASRIVRPACTSPHSVDRKARS